MLKGKRFNKRILLLLIMILAMVCMTGCKDKYYRKFEGVTTRRFEKDLNRLRKLIIASMSEEEYNTDMDDVIEEMNSVNYTKRLTAQEIIILGSLNKSMNDLKKDLSTGNKLISSYTFDDLNWLLQATTEEP